MKHPLNTLSYQYSRKRFVLAFFVASLMGGALFFAPIAHAISVDVGPIIIDWEGQRREEFRETISITNNTGRVVTVWPIIADIDAETGAMSIPDGPGDHSGGLAAWVSMKRTNIYLKPGATKTVGLKIQSNVHAKIGTHHGIIAFPVADSFDDAELKIEGAGKSTVTLRVLEDRKEQLNIKRFGALSRVLFAFPVSMGFEVDNGGNVDTPVTGKIRFFDRHDKNIGEVVLDGRESVAEGETLPLTIDWSGAGSLGRHKAIIELQYGKANIVTDSTFFYVVPWWAVAVFVGLSLLAVALVTRIISRAHTHHK